MPKRKPKHITRPGLVPCRFTAFFDGCCEPINPGGTAGYGVAIFERERISAAPAPAMGEFMRFLNEDGTHVAVTLGRRVYEHSGIVEASPTTSNNVAELLAVNCIMDWLVGNGYEAESCQAFGDSKLAINVVWPDPVTRKRWKITGIDHKLFQPAGRYAPHAVRARELLKKLPRLTGHWIRRHNNSIADDLSKAELRRAGVEFRIQPEPADEETVP